MVNGIFVLKNGKTVGGVFPGRLFMESLKRSSCNNIARVTREYVVYPYYATVMKFGGR
jgi:hypothetical protein